MTTGAASVEWHMPRRRVWMLVAAALLGAVAGGLGAILPDCNDSYLCRWLRWRQSDVGDLARFPSEMIGPAADPRPVGDGARLENIVVTTGGVEQPLESVLERSGTLAFLVLHGDRLAYEFYAPGYDRYRTVTSFSVAKSVAGLLAGIAEGRGLFTLAAPLTGYLPELRERDPAFERIALADLLAMRSGIGYRDHDLFWGHKPQSYYHPELRRVALERRIAAPPGGFVYNNWNPILLGLALERATGVSVASFTEAELWRPMGAERPASWSLDSQSDAMAKMESGFNAAPIDFARLGRLLLDRGRRGERQVVPEAFVARLWAPDEALRVREGLHYQGFWWLHVADDGQPWALAAWGHLGQFVYAFPQQDVVVVRFGRRLGEVGDFESWGALLRQVAGATGAAP